MSSLPTRQEEGVITLVGGRWLAGGCWYNFLTLSDDGCATLLLTYDAPVPFTDRGSPTAIRPTLSKFGFHCMEPPYAVEGPLEEEVV